MLPDFPESLKVFVRFPKSDRRNPLPYVPLNRILCVVMPVGFEKVTVSDFEKQNLATTRDASIAIGSAAILHL